MRPLAFLDVVTTGLSPERHQLLELCVLRVDPRSLEVVLEHDTRVAPEHLQDAQPEALQLCGFSPAAWADAVPLRDALLRVQPLLEGTQICGHHIAFAWRFLEKGFRQSGLAPPRIHLHQMDTASLAWPLWAAGRGQTLSLDALARRFVLERALPQRALANVRLALEVARNLVGCVSIGDRVGRLPADEREITDALLDCLDDGAELYGKWNVHERRVYERKAHEEVPDVLHYVAAAIAKRRQDREGRRQRVYVCHALRGDPAGNIERVRAISQVLIAEGVLPIAPHLYLPQLIDKATGCEQALSLGLELLATCDEVRVFGDVVTEAMDGELREAKRLSIPAHFVREVRA